jgi:hypothetical protein
MLAYLSLTLAYVLYAGLWAALPFLVLFVLGYGYVFVEGIGDMLRAEHRTPVAGLSPGRAT